MASLLTPATFIGWSQTQLLFSRSTVSKTTSGIPKAKTPLSFSGQAEVLQDDLRGANALLSIPGGDEILLYSPSHVPDGHCDHLEECTYFSRFTKVSTEGSPLPEGHDPFAEAFSACNNKDTWGPNTGLPGAAAYLQSARLFTVRGA